MCGILAVLGRETLTVQALKELKLLIDKRGPDYSSPETCEHRTKCGLHLQLGASVLHLRGDEMQTQPMIDEDGNILLFNGQIYEFAKCTLDIKISDTTFLAERLKSCKTNVEIAQTFAAIDGPFAFIYWHEDLNTLFYGRDLFGRKSLCSLAHEADKCPHSISSVARKECESDGSPPITLNWSEVNCMGFHGWDFTDNPSRPKRIRFMWDLEQVYPKTSRCHSPENNCDTEYIVIPASNHLAPLNPDTRLHGEFSESEWTCAIDGFGDRLVKAVSRRIKYNRQTCLECRRCTIQNDISNQQCHHSKVAVAFSGGVDSVLLALVLDKVVHERETIDLITVAFKDGSQDRVSVGSAFQELMKLCPTRNWRLVLCDISKTMLKSERDQVIRHLISPCNTVLDDSIGCACWFISRGKGRSIDSSAIKDADLETVFEEFLEYDTISSDTRKYSLNSNSIMDSYSSPATMFFAGMGIDEQLGGYSSHRAAWSSSKTPGVFDEISFQMRRISYRNLGRDDRTCSHHGRDVKLPYLDFDLVSYLNQLPIGLKMNLDEPQDVGPKKLLRELASRWGLKDTSRRVKRALQFGTKIANLENPGEHGNDICLRLTTGSLKSRDDTKLLNVDGQ